MGVSLCSEMSVFLFERFSLSVSPPHVRQAVDGPGALEVVVDLPGAEDVPLHLRAAGSSRLTLTIGRFSKDCRELLRFKNTIIPLPDSTWSAGSNSSAADGPSPSGMHSVC